MSDRKAAPPIRVTLGDVVDDWRDAVAVLTSLRNPRGMLALGDGRYLLVEAGIGTPGSGRVLELRRSPWGWSVAGVAQNGLPSMHLQEVLLRDEVIGPSALAFGPGGEIVMTLCVLPELVTRICRLAPAPDGHVLEAPGISNGVVYLESERAWFMARSSMDDVQRVDAGGASCTAFAFPKLGAGQDAVPSSICVDATAERTLLVSLFSGEVDTDRSGGPGHKRSPWGINFLHGQGKICACDLDTGAVRDVVTGLTTPTACASIGETILVLELCDAFLEPLVKRADLLEMRHGTFRRFSGRLLAIDRRSGVVRCLVDGLDCPSNLLVDGHRVLISQGQGFPGRPIPGPDGASTPLDGVLAEVDVSELRG